MPYLNLLHAPFKEVRIYFGVIHKGEHLLVRFPSQVGT